MSIIYKYPIFYVAISFLNIKFKQATFETKTPNTYLTLDVFFRHSCMKLLRRRSDILLQLNTVESTVPPIVPY